MADREIAFSTFMKLLELDEVKKEAMLRGFLRGGGFNYWRPLQMLAPDVVGGTLDLNGVQESVASLSKGHQRKYNDHALTNLLKWANRRSVQKRQRPGRIVKKFSNSGISVRLEPEVAFAMDGRNYLMHLWATNSPVLSEETLSMALYFFKFHFRGTTYSDFQFLIFDTVKDKIFAEFNVLQNASLMLSQQREIIGSLWSSVNGGGGKTPLIIDDRQRIENEDGLYTR